MSGSNFQPYLKFNQQANAFLGAFHQPLTEKLEPFFQSEDAAKGADGMFAQVAAGAYPQEAGWTDFLDRSPYDNPEQLRADLEAAAERGWVDLTDTGFKAADKALAFTDRLVAKLMSYAAEQEATLAVDMPRLVGMLQRLVDGAEAAPFEFKPSFTFGRNYEYDDRTPSLLWVRRHLISLGSYRDDCHLAAWRRYQLPGYVWEALTFVWRGEISTAEKLVEQLPFRSYTPEDYARALDRLVELGWARRDEEGGYALTDAGRNLREQAEISTDENYKAAFGLLSDHELAELTSVLEAMTEVFTIEAEEGAPAG